MQPVQPVQVAVGGPGENDLNTPATLSRCRNRRRRFDRRLQTGRRISQATDNTADSTAKSSNDSTAVATNSGPTEQTGSGNDVASALRTAAQQHGEEVVAVGGSNKTTTTSNGQQATSTKQYTAVAGDTFWKIVGREMGANTKANRDAFIAANPSLKDDPSKIFAGHVYNIPTSVCGSTSADCGFCQHHRDSVEQRPYNANTTAPKASANTLPAATAGDNWYTIKSGDTLTSIAEEQCGTTQAVAAILELNKDTEKDPDRVIINSKIRLPNKPVASAN